MRSIGLVVSLVSLLVAMTATTAAQDVSLNRSGSGARAAGMGNAFIAVSDDGTAASWNPAGLAQLREAELSLVHSTGRRNRQFDGFRTNDGSSVFTNVATGNTTADIEFASAAVPFRVAGRPVTLQVGWRRLYDLAARGHGDQQRLPVTAAGRPASTIRVDATTDGGVNLWSLAGAVGVTNRLSIGWSLDLYRSGWEERNNLSEFPGIQGGTDFLASVQPARLTGEAINVGVLLTYPTVSVGLVYHGPLEADLRQTVSRRSSFFEPVLDQARLDFRFPRSVGAGVAWRPRPLLRLALDVTYDDWTDFLVKDKGAPDSEAVNFFDLLPPELSASRDTVSINGGLERLFPVHGLFVPLRLGAAYEPQGGREPVLRDGLAYKVLAVGTGLNTNSVKFDVSLEHRWGSIRGSDNLSLVYLAGLAEDFGLPPAPEAVGTVSFHQWRLKASMIYRVTDTERLTDVLGRLFGS